MQEHKAFYMTPLPVEEDGDEVFTPMPVYCQQFNCLLTGRSPRLVRKNGFIVCPKCGASYGKSPRKRKQ